MKHLAASIAVFISVLAVSSEAQTESTGWTKQFHHVTLTELSAEGPAFCATLEARPQAQCGRLLATASSLIEQEFGIDIVLTDPFETFTFDVLIGGRTTNGGESGIGDGVRLNITRTLEGS